MEIPDTIIFKSDVGERPMIENTRIPTIRIFQLFDHGHTKKEIVTQIYPHLTYSQVEAALFFEEHFIYDGFGSIWSRKCSDCGFDSIVLVRPGKIQCDNCKKDLQEI